jgi:parallel beta-helix repeat protein
VTAGLGSLALVLALAPTVAESRAHAASRAAKCDRLASTSGDDRAPGTASRPFRSAERLVESLRPGQTGCLQGGTFEEDLAIERGGAPGKPITLRSAPGRRATLVGVLDVKDSADDVVLAGLRLIGRGRASPQVNGDRVTFRGNEITNRNTGICLLLGAGFESRYGRARNVVIDRNHIHHCGRLPARGHDHGIYVEGTDGVRITNNVINDNADYGIHLYPDAQGTYVARNVIDQNGGGVVFAGEDADGEYEREYASSNNVVRNNVISNSREKHNVESSWGGPVGVSNLATRNCLWNGARGNMSDRVGFRSVANVVARPLFRNRAGGDFRLRRGSACARILTGR